MVPTFLSWFLSTAIELFTAISILLVLMAMLYMIQRSWCNLSRYRYGQVWIWVFGVVGVPNHELSHSFFCPIFGHRIKEIVLFKPDGSGTLGYVNHCYNGRSVWAVIGNLFIGIAPIFGGCGTIALATYIILPGDYVFTVLYEQYISTIDLDTLFFLFLCVTRSLFDVAIESPIEFALWLYVTTAISLFLAPSPADIRGSATGFFFFLVALSIIKWGCEYYGFPLFTYVNRVVTAISLQLVLSILVCSLLVVSFYLFVMMIRVIKPNKEIKEVKVI